MGRKQRKEDFTFDVVGIPRGEQIEPDFRKRRSVEWDGKRVTHVMVIGAKHVMCNGHPIPLGDLTKAIRKDFGLPTSSGIQSSQNWRWRGKRLDELHTAVHVSRRVAALLYNDFEQAIPAFRSMPSNTQAKMFALAICFAVTAVMLQPKADIAEEQFFITHVLNLILGDAQTRKEAKTFKDVIEDYSQALENGDIVECDYDQ